MTECFNGVGMFCVCVEESLRMGMFICDQDNLQLSSKHVQQRAPAVNTQVNVMQWRRRTHREIRRQTTNKSHPTTALLPTILSWLLTDNRDPDQTIVRTSKQKSASTILPPLCVTLPAAWRGQSRASRRPFPVAQQEGSTCTRHSL